MMDSGGLFIISEGWEKSGEGGEKERSDFARKNRRMINSQLFHIRNISDHY